MQYVAGLIELLAKIIIGNKSKWGHIIHLVSGLLWTYVALTAPMYGLLLVTLPATGINIYNFIKWNREDAGQDILFDR